MALFITFEGGDGSGKSTQAVALVDRLKKEKQEVVYAQEPGTTLFGKMLRGWLSAPRGSLTLIPEEGTQLALMEKTVDDSLLPNLFLHEAAPRTELLAFTIARAQLVDEVILPNLKNQKIIICNRYADSTMAYQGYGRGVDLRLVAVANEIATRGVKPNLTVLLDLPPEKGLARKYGELDRFETQQLEFHRLVRKGYLELAAQEPERWLVIDGTRSKAEIKEMIWQRVEKLITTSK